MPAALPKLKIGAIVHGFKILSVSDEGRRRLKQTTYRVKALACGCEFEIGHYGLINRLPRIPTGICKPHLMILRHNGIFGNGFDGARQELLERMKANGADVSAFADKVVEKAPTPAPPVMSAQGRLMRQWGLA